MLTFLTLQTAADHSQQRLAFIEAELHTIQAKRNDLEWFEQDRARDLYLQYRSTSDIWRHWHSLTVLFRILSTKVTDDTAPSLPQSDES